MKKIVFAASALLLVFISSCKVEPGSGGVATISGKVYAYDINMFNTRLDSGYIADQRVFLSYGDNTTVDEDTRTSYTGEYKFDKLRKGTYKVWVVSECNSCPLDQTADIKTVTINEIKENVVVEDLVTFY